jgi:PAS domain-containing protein
MVGDFIACHDGHSHQGRAEAPPHHGRLGSRARAPTSQNAWHCCGRGCVYFMAKITLTCKAAFFILHRTTRKFSSVDHRFPRRQRMSSLAFDVNALKKIPLFDSIINSLHDGVLITDDEGYIKYVNTSYLRLTGVAEEAVLGRKGPPRDQTEGQQC